MFGVQGTSGRFAAVGACALLVLAGLASSASADGAQLRGRGGGHDRVSRGGGGGGFHSDRGHGGHSGGHGGGYDRGHSHGSRTNVSINIGSTYGSWNRPRSSWDCPPPRYTPRYDTGFSIRIGSPAYCPPPRVYCPPPRVICPPAVVVRPCPTYVVSTPVVYTQPVYQPVYTQPVVVTTAPEPIYVTQPAPQVIVRQEAPAPIIVSSRPTVVQTRLDEVQTTSMTSTGGAVIQTASTAPTTITQPIAGAAPSQASVGGVVTTASSDIVPADLAISALRTGVDSVVLSISGTNDSATYQMGLALEGEAAGAPVIRLRNAPPLVSSGTIGGSAVAAAKTPFTMNATVRAASTAGTVNVRIADREYQVPIVDAPRLGN